MHVWLPVLLVTIPAFLALLGTMLTLFYGQRGKIRENIESQTTEVLKIGMTTYVEKLQSSLDACEERSDRNEEIIRQLQRDKNKLEMKVEEHEAYIIRLKRRIGDIP